ncbi:MAG TPA: flavin reductase family protein [Rhizobiaceae bacterium]|nr:flavin reductase family protein [Rhizobiaceae bacterium]
MSSGKTDTEQSQPFDVREFRAALGGFVTGVTVVTTNTRNGPAGFTANSFTSVSLDPPMVLVCIGKTSSNFDNFLNSDRFCVNILGEHQRHVSKQFSAKVTDRFEGISWTRGVLDNPIIDDSIAWFDCTLEQRIDAGDHHVLIGRVRDFSHSIGSPLAYCRGNYVMFDLDQQILSSRHHRARFGAILETPEGIVFVHGDRTGSFALPTSPRLGTRKINDGLFGTLSSLGIEFDLEFLFSVWEEDNADRMNVFYRGSAIGSLRADQGRIFPVHDLPFDKLERDDRRLLTRYKEERENFRFSVYSGTSSDGNFWEVKQGPKVA